MENASILEYYEHFLGANHFVSIATDSRFNAVGQCWKLSPELGEGYYWVYSKDNLYDIKIHDFFFYKDFFMEFCLPECLSITQYESISGEEWNPYRRLMAGCIKTYIGEGKPYKALIHKKIPIKCIGIEIMPAYYEEYLRKHYPHDYVNPLSAFRKIDQTTTFPKMSRLLCEVKTYRGDGISAALFYESKVSEAVSLILDEQKHLNGEKREDVETEDRKQIENVILYLNDHYVFDIPIERLSKIACMGTTKLKMVFKQMQGCTITSYIQQRRMGQAEYLLTNTDFRIGQIAQMVGYSTSSRFAQLFRRSTGLLPTEYRNLARRK